MDALSSAIVCDGCGLPASADHLAARLYRLEFVTRFRPIHIHTLFVALEPMARPEDDFYGPAESREFFDSLLLALDISPHAGNDAEKPHAEPNGAVACIAKLLEFQRRGYYLTYLSECPASPQHPAMPRAGEKTVLECLSRLAPTLVKRIRFNYKPKHVVLLGTNLEPLIGIFDQAGIGPLLLLDHGAPLTIPKPGDAPSLTLFRRAVKIATPCATTSSGV
jgi:hypothetical protein